MASGVVTVGRHRYVVGLYWENSPGGGRVAQIAKEAARQPGQQADFYAVRPGNKDGRVPQFGLCSADAGQEAGVAVLAGCLATQIPGSWAGAFRLPEGTVVTIVRDDLIVPDGDLFFSDESEARDRLLQEMSFGGLRTIYAPEAWSVPGADSIPLTLLLNDAQQIKLQRVAIPRQAKVVAAVVAGVFVLGLGVVWYLQEELGADEAVRAAQEEALRRQQAALIPAVLKPPPPPEVKYVKQWEESPSAYSFVVSCKNRLKDVPLAVQGWRLASLRCSGGQMSLSWSREKGAGAPPSGSIISDDASMATRSLPLEGMSPRGAEALLNIDDVTKRYLSQDWPGNIARVTDDPLPPPPPGYAGVWNPLPPPWVKRSFTLNVAELPAGLYGIIGNLPGAVINSVTYSLGGMASTWAIEGVIYENRK